MCRFSGEDCAAISPLPCPAADCETESSQLDRPKYDRIWATDKSADEPSFLAFTNGLPVFS
jgi:hypothetical protein